jgi:uncharacterized protein (TIGR02145 family)
MKTNRIIYLLAASFQLVLLHLSSAYGQKPVMELTFTANYYGQYVPLDSILIENLTQGGDTLLYWPDSVLILDYATGVNENPSSSVTIFEVGRNYPNPFSAKTTFSIYLPLEDFLQVIVFNPLGQKVVEYKNILESGYHLFTFFPGNENIYFMTATVRGATKSLKMFSLSSRLADYCSLFYAGKETVTSDYKSNKEITDFGFSLGDILRFIAYAKTPVLINGSDVIEDAPLSNQTYTFEILEGIPCPGTPTVPYEGQTYNTVQIGSQCWFKENLNVGTMINGSGNQTNNSQKEKYCYGDNAANCATYGGLYQWNEMMQYSTTPGVQGICPSGWHIPTDAEWCTLTQFIDPMVNCNSTGWSGQVVGTKMKSTTGWNSGGNGTNTFGFTALPGGRRDNSGAFYDIGGYGYWWSSTEGFTSSAWFRVLRYNSANVSRDFGGKVGGRSVRCLQD